MKSPIKKGLRTGGIVLTSVALSSMLIACSSDKTASSGDNKGSEKETIVWSYWGDPWEVDINNQVEQAFEAKYPNINIEPQHAPWSSYFDKLQTQMAAGEVPDVMFLDNVPSYAAKGVLMSIDDLVKEHGFDMNDFYEGQLTAFRYDGKLYGVPRDNDTKVLYYNKKLFDQAGLKYPSQGWTWDEMREDAKKMTKMESGVTTQYGMAFEPDSWPLWVLANGGEIFDNYEKPTKTLLNSKQAADAIQFMGDLMNVDKVAPSYDLQKDSSNISQLFTTGRVGMIIGNHALVPSFQKTPGLEWDIAGIPTAKGVKPVNLAGGAGYAIAKNTKHKEAAYKLWSFLLGEEGQKIFTKSNVMVPTSKKVLASDDFMKQPYQANVFVEQTQAGHAMPTYSGWSEASSKLSSALQAVWINQEKAGDAISKVIPEVEATFKK
ncbi:MAG: sugar ABC transporter substrate-binding protein [Tumebacillaceae bacterium]